MFHKVLNNIKLASQIKRNVIKIRLNNNDMKIIRLLIQLNFINFLYKPVKKTTNKHDNYYYVSINTKGSMKFKNLYRPSGIRTISYKELSKDSLLKKSSYVLSTSRGVVTQDIAIKYKLSGILLMVFYI